MKAPIKVAVTGAAGQIGYALLPRIASGQVFGADQPVILHLIEIEPVLPALEGVVMELEDGAFPLLKGVVATASSDAGFNGVNWVIFVGGIPRKEGMERKDLLQVNGKMFVGQGKALEKNAASDVRVLMVANPANTNALILAHNAPSIPKNRITAMTRLDENRAKTQLAKKAKVDVDQVTNLAVWGNHSSTQYPDFVHAKIGGKKATDVITDRAWLEGEFITTIQQRGAAVIKARKSSSAFSAANAAIDSVRSILEPTPKGDWHSVCVWSDENPYGVAKGLVTSFPVRSNGGGHWEIVPGLEIDSFSKSKIDASNKELEDERAMVADLIPK